MLAAAAAAQVLEVAELGVRHQEPALLLLVEVAMVVLALKVHLALVEVVHKIQVVEVVEQQMELNLEVLVVPELFL
jgi:hypothetical protein